MLEAFLIIVILGGLETLLWWLQRRHEEEVELEDKMMQAKQLVAMDGILTELAIQNGVEDLDGTSQEKTTEPKFE